MREDKGTYCRTYEEGQVSGNVVMTKEAGIFEYGNNVKCNEFLEINKHFMFFEAEGE